MSQKSLRSRWLFLFSLSALACGIIFQSTTVVQEDESNVTTLTIAIDKSLLVDTATAQRWRQQVTIMTTYLQERGASVQAFANDQYDGLQASIAFPDLASLNAQQPGDELSLFETFTLKRWRGEFVLEARTSSALIRQRIQQITGLSEGDLLLVQFPLNLSIQLPGTLLYSTANQQSADGTQTWAINWLSDETHVLNASSQVPLLPPVITQPSAGSRIKDASAGVDFAGTGEPGADITLYRVTGNTRAWLAEGVIGADRTWQLPGVKLGEPGQYTLMVEERTDHDTATSEREVVEYRPLEPIVFVPGYYACAEGLTGNSLLRRVVTHRFWDSNTFGLFDAAYTIYGPLFVFFEKQGYQINQNLFVACYDWTEPLPQQADEFSQMLEYARATNPGQLPVTVVTHSNGGLVARYYIQHNPLDSHRSISSLILIAPPNQGVVRSYYAWEGGDISYEERNIQLLLKLSFQRHCGLLPSLILTRQYKEKVYACIRHGQSVSFDLKNAGDNTIPSVAWLLPSFPFLKNDGGPPVSYPSAPISRLNTGDQIHNLLSGVNGKISILAGEVADSTAYTLTVRAAPDWDGLWQMGYPTTDAQKHLGDGTVLRHSVELPVIASFPNLYPVTVYADAWHSDPNDSDSQSLFQKQTLLQKISDLIREEFPADVDLSTWSDVLLIWVGSPVNLLVTDAQGRRLGVDAAGNLLGEIPDASFSDTDNLLGPKFIVIADPIEGDYRFEVTGLATGDYQLYGLSTTSDDPVIAESGRIDAGEKVAYQAIYQPATARTRSRLTLTLLLVVLALSVVAIGGVIVWRRKRSRRATHGLGTGYSDVDIGFDLPPKKRWWQHRKKGDFDDPFSS